MIRLDVAFSTCPNDTFIFHALLHDCIDTGDYRFVAHMHDVEALNKKAFAKTKSQKEAGRFLGCYTSTSEESVKYSIFRQECARLGVKIKDFK